MAGTSTIQAASNWLKEKLAYVFGKDALLHSYPGLAAVMPQNLATIVTLGGAAALSATLTEINYRSKNKDIRDMYSEELAAKLGKSPGGVTKTDLETLAGGDPSHGIESNRTIAQAVHKNWKQRNLGVFLSAAASVVSFGLLLVATQGMGEASGAAVFIAKAIIGLATYSLVKAPLHWLGNKLFDVDAKTTHDRIMDIQKDRDAGKSITRQEILSVFVSAHPELDGMIQNKYGVAFKNLDVAHKHELVESIGKAMRIDQITNDINAGKTNVTELAFAVDGQVSGVAPKDPAVEPQRGLLGRIKDKCMAVMRHIVDRAKHAPKEIPLPAPVEAPAAADTPPAMENRSGPSFVNRVGHAPITTSMSHVDRLNQQSRGATPQR